ncbi:MAG: hypothetical protein GXO79_11490 [Chlorobi bacterium]|nr:hypothetical protein [Chlorobiota bacterium]
MKNSALIKTVLIFSVFFLLVGVVSATNVITVATPAAAASISGSAYTITATLDSNDGNVTNVSIYYQSPGASTWNLIATVQNTSTAQTSFSTTWDTTAFVDDNDYTINATAPSAAGTTSTDTSTGVDIDNGNPTATLSSATFTTNKQRFGAQTFSMGLNADATIGISSCIIYCTDTNNGNVYSTTASVSANACSNTTLTPKTFSLVKARAYNCLVQATDGNGDSTNSSSRLLTYVVESSGHNPSIKYFPNTPHTNSFLQNFISNIINFFKGLF